MLISRRALAPVRTRVPAQIGASALRLMEPSTLKMRSSINHRGWPGGGNRYSVIMSSTVMPDGIMGNTCS
jgi:hypothetical protein